MNTKNRPEDKRCAKLVARKHKGGSKFKRRCTGETGHGPGGKYCHGHRHGV